MRSVRERLLDIKEAIAQIEKYAIRGKDAFEQDELVQTWMIHHLKIIGEASARLPDDFRKRHSDVPWSKIIGMRNILVHNYFGIDLAVVWQVAERELPVLRQNIESILKSESSEKNNE